MALKLFVLYFLNAAMIAETRGQFFREYGMACSSDEWQCEDGYCISSSKVCDRQKNCPDGSDENWRACSWATCRSGEMYCGDYTCVDSKLACNGVNDCKSGYDESRIHCLQSTVCQHVPHIKNGRAHLDHSNMFKYITGETNKKPSTLSYDCNFGYALGKGSLTCINGTWIGKAPECFKCGETMPGPRQKTPEGPRIQYGVAPWHAGIYSKLTKPYSLICGGSLITAKYILSESNFTNRRMQFSAVQDLNSLIS